MFTSKPEVITMIKYFMLDSYEEKETLNVVCHIVCMRGYRYLYQGGPGPTNRKELWQIFLVLNLFYSGISMFYFKENYHFPSFQRRSNMFQGGPTFSRESNISRGVHILIPIESHRTCDFPGTGPPTPLWIRAWSASPIQTSM